MTSEWQVMPLQKLTSDGLRNGIFKKKDRFGTGTRLVNVADVYRRLQVDPRALERIQITPEEQSRFSARPGDLLFVRSSLKKEGIAQSCMVGHTEDPLVFECHLIRVRPDQGRIDPVFLAYYTHSASFRLEVLAHAKTVAFTTIGQDALGGISVQVPPLLEQHKIAAILSSVDDTIEKTQAVIDQLQVVKKAMMQELLTRGIPGRHTRFKQTEIGEVPEGWEVVYLGSLISRGPDNGLYKPQSEYGAGVPIVRIDAFANGTRITDAGLRRVQATREEIERFGLRPNDILVNRVNSLSHLGKVAFAVELHEPTVFESNMMRLAVDAQRILPEFAFLVLAAPNTKSFFLSRAKQAVAQASINQQDLQAVSMPLPCLAEQQRIVTAFSCIEARQDIEQQFFEVLTFLKSALMSVLLTGELRVTPDAPAPWPPPPAKATLDHPQPDGGQTP